MIGILLTIALLHWIVLITPGANFLLVGQLAASGQRSTACTAAVGISTVTFCWASLAILGLGVVFSTHPALRQACQLAGGAYLCYLGVKLWRSRGESDTAQTLTVSKLAAFRLGFVTNVLNPKTALFFGSVFATALPLHPSTFLVLSAVVLVYVDALVWHLFLALAFSHPRVQAAYGQRRSQLNRVSGVMVGAFGAKLLGATLQEFRSRGA